MLLQNRNMRALDRMFDRLTAFGGFNSPLAMVDRWFDNLENTIEVASNPAEGTYYTVYEMKPVRYQVRKDEKTGDIIHHRLTDEEVEALEKNREEEVKEAA